MKYIMNEDMVIFEQNNKIIIDLYKEHAQMAIHPKFLQVLFFFKQQHTLDEAINNELLVDLFDEEVIGDIVEQFIDKSMLVDVSKKMKKENMNGINLLSKSIQYYYWANRVYDDEKYESTYEEFIKLNGKRGNQPSIYKEYKTNKILHLPTPSEFKADLLLTILDRQSIRYTNKNLNISMQDISDILYYSVGETAYAFDSGMGGALFKPTPTPGGRANTEIYLINLSNTLFEKGLYHYSVKTHCLEMIKPGNYREEMYKISGNQEQLNFCNIILVATERMDRITWKYQDASAYRSVLIESGLISQNIYLTGTAKRVAVGMIGTFKDSLLVQLLQINATIEIPTVLFTLGRRNNISRFDRPDLKYYEGVNENDE